MGAIKNAIVGVGIATALAFGVNAIKNYTETGDAIHKLSLRTGFGTESLSKLSFAAEQSGTDIGTIETAVRRMASVVFDANAGLAESERAFNALGLSAKSLEQLSPEEQFLKIANALANVENASTKAAPCPRRIR